MSRPSRRTLFWWALTLACLACGGPQPAGVPSPVEVDLAHSDAPVAELLRERLEAAREEPQDAERRAELGMAYEVNGFAAAASASYEQAVALDPALARWHYLLALSRAAEGELDPALTAMRAALEREAAYLPAHLNAGQWLLDLGRPAEAEAHYREAIALAPGEAAARLGLGRALLRGGRGVEAIRVLERLAGERPGDGHVTRALAQAYREAGEPDKAAALASGLQPGPPPGWADPWTREKAEYRVGFGAGMLRGEELLSRGRHAEALELFEALRRERPQDPALINNLSIAYRRTGQPERAHEVLLEGVAAHPDYFPFHVNLSAAYQREGDLDQALVHIDRVIELNPSLAEGHQRRGSILSALRRLDEALEAYETALRHDPADARTRLFAGAVAAELRDWPRATEHLQEAARLAPRMVEAHTTLALVRAEAGDFDGAEAALERAAALDPDGRRVAATRQRVARLREVAR